MPGPSLILYNKKMKKSSVNRKQFNSTFMASLLFCLAFLPTACKRDQAGEAESTPALQVEASSSVPAAAFFNRLKTLCGKSYWGRFVHPQQPPFPFAGSELLLEVAECRDAEIRLTFHVGEDASRNWIISQIDDRLGLLHDHRRTGDGQEETNHYGGLTLVAGSSFRQDFPADETTIEKLPRAAGSVWSMSFSDDGTVFSYILARAGEILFHVDFDLKSPRQ